MTEIKKLGKSQIEIVSEVNTEEFEGFYKKTLNSFKNKVELSGFRKGHVPEKIIIEKFSREILEESAEKAISEKYPTILKENNINALGSPEITITKLALGNPLSFSARVAILPEFDLPDYKKISIEKNKEKTDSKTFEPTQKEIDDVIMQIRTANLSKDDLNKKEGKTNPPELDDESVKKLGDFKNLEDFLEKLKKNIRDEKEYRDREKKRALILEAILKETEIDLPDIVVESELDRMVSEFQSQIERMGMKMEDYLKHIKKTEKDLREGQREEALRRAKTQLILNRIALKENIKPEEEKVKREVEHLTLHHKDADPEKIRIYVETVLSNQMVVEFLESLK